MREYVDGGAFNRFLEDYRRIKREPGCDCVVVKVDKDLTSDSPYSAYEHRVNGQVIEIGGYDPKMQSFFIQSQFNAEVSAAQRCSKCKQVVNRYEMAMVDDRVCCDGCLPHVLRWLDFTVDSPWIISSGDYLRVSRG